MLERTADLHPLAPQRWMTSPDRDLVVGDPELSPAEWLATGGPAAPVLALASDLPAVS